MGNLLGSQSTQLTYIQNKEILNLVFSPNDPEIIQKIDAFIISNPSIIKKIFSSNDIEEIIPTSYISLLNTELELNLITRIYEESTLLSFACRYYNSFSSLDIVKCLIKHNFDVNVKNNHQNTPLHTACRYGHVEVVEELLRNGADINALNNTNCTPLMLASCSNHKKVVNILLKQSNININVININAINSQGYTALSYNLQMNYNEDIIMLLLQNNADPYIKNSMGKDAFDVVFGYKKDRLMKIINGISKKN
jgi:ankyrin repeat protein